MNNVYSFQRIISGQQCVQSKNISKTSHFRFGMNHKRLVANSKGSLDYRKFLQINNKNRRHLLTREPLRNPLQQVFTSQGNFQSFLHNKALNIRCYTKMNAKQNQTQQQRITSSKSIQCNPKVYGVKEWKVQPTARKTQKLFTKLIRMHKFDNFQELQPIASNIKVVYNDNINQPYRYVQKAVIIDIDYVLSCILPHTSKNNEKVKERQHLRRRIVHILKRAIGQQHKISAVIKTGPQQMPQIIFKVQKDQQITQLLRIFQQCEFRSYYCIFNIQKRFVESLGTYNLMKIGNLAQNVVMIDSVQGFVNCPPLLDSSHFIALSTFSQKFSLGDSLYNLFGTIRNLHIRFSAQQFQSQDQSLGRIISIDKKQLLERVKQRKALKNWRKPCQKRQKCHSLIQTTHINIRRRQQDRNLQIFKQKILKYLKTVLNGNGLQSKRYKQLSNYNQDFQCMTGRQQCSKTNHQLVSELIRLNSQVHKQIYDYRRKMESIQKDNYKQQPQTVECLGFQKIYVNVLN